MTRWQANALLLFSGAIWGMGFVAQSTAMASIGPLLFIGLRFAAASLSVLPFAIREARTAPPMSDGGWAGLVSIGLLLFAGMTAQQFGLLTTSVTNSGFLTGLYVVMVPFLSVLVFRVWPNPVVWPAAACAFAGIWLLSGGSVSALKTGDWLTILCAAIWAVQVILIGRFAASTGRPIMLALVQFAVCATLGLLSAGLWETINLQAIRQVLPEILFAGVFSGGLAFTLQAVGQRYTTPAQAAIFLSSEAVFAAIFGAWLLGERIGPIGLLGCAMIFAAIIAVEALPAALERRESSAPDFKT